jgi:hypothetical protein|nr:MAG TPA: hypothetical protein [Caudoviricetes sp.]
MKHVKKINIDDVNLIESYEDIINILARTNKRSDLFLIIRTIFRIRRSYRLSRKAIRVFNEAERKSKALGVL